MISVSLTWILDFGFLLKVLKIGEKGVSEMISEPQNRSVDGETVRLANDNEKTGLENGITKEAWRTWVCARLWKIGSMRELRRLY